MKCSRCGSEDIEVSTIAEGVKAGCGTYLLYILLACTVVGLLIVIPLMLRQKTVAKTYAVCKSCGNRWLIR